MDFIGLNDEGIAYVNSYGHYSDVYAYTLPDGNVAHLRVFRGARVPVTCSSGGVVEIAQEYVGGKLFTCLVQQAYWFNSESTLPPGYADVPLMYDPNRKIYVLNKEVSTVHAFCKWKRGTPLIDPWWGFDAGNGIISDKMFEIEKQIKEGDLHD